MDDEQAPGPESSDRPRSEHPVALNVAPGGPVNTIVVGGVDLVIPLELDLDHDPDSDDHVRLRSRDGTFVRVLSSADPDAEQDPEKPLRRYTFRDVSFGYYAVSVLVKDVWSEVITDLRIGVEGVFLHGQPLSPSDDAALGTPEEDEADETDALLDDVQEGYFDPNFDAPEGTET